MANTPAPARPLATITLGDEAVVLWTALYGGTILHLHGSSIFWAERVRCLWNKGGHTLNEQIRSTIREVEEFIKGREDALPIPRDAGEFVYAMLRATGARYGVEIGTSYGYSGLWAAAALSQHGGTLITIDHDSHKHEVASRFFAAAGLAEVVRCECGRAIDVLKRIEGPIDYLLNDADKENCISYVEAVLDKLSPRAVILTDNTLTHEHQLAAFCAWIRNRPDFASAAVPVGNGMELSVYGGA